MSRLPDLHDSRLINFCLDWQSGIARILIKSAASYPAQVTLTVSGILSAEISRQMAWGYSESINECTLETCEVFQELRIDMQSGDTILLIIESNGRVSVEQSDV